MVAEQSAGSMADVEQTPLPEEVETSGGGVGAMESMIRGLQSANTLKPIDLKDIEKPDKYDNNIAQCTIWYERFRDLLENRHPNWEHVCEAIEKAGKTIIASVGTKEKALSPPRAAKTADVDRVLTEWKYVRRQILEEDPNYMLDDETLQTLLMKIIPNDCVKSMRELSLSEVY